jgi:hypothetical protein
LAANRNELTTKVCEAIWRRDIDGKVAPEIGRSLGASQTRFRG